MSRSVDEWIGKTDDSKPPPRVCLRVLIQYDGICQCGCGIKIRAGAQWQTDHHQALINGGENRESNLRPIFVEHHKTKTRKDVKEKSATYHKQLKHYGIKAGPKGRPMPGTKASGLRKRMNGTVERRKRCDGCGTNWADLPRRLCVGCDAYQEHQR